MKKKKKQKQFAVKNAFIADIRQSRRKQANKMHICLFVLNLRQLESSKRNEKTKQKTKHKKTHAQNTQNQNVVVV